MEKKLVIHVLDECNNYTRSQEVWSDDCKKVSYSVYDLSECPEDAVIGRELFSAYQYIEAIKLGMELAKQGYTGIEVNEAE